MTSPRKKDERKEKKKIQWRLIAAKKKLIEMEQQHVFDGLYGVKEQRDFLANQIVTVNSKLLQQALQYITTPVARYNLVKILNAVPKSNTSKLSNYPISASNRVRSDPNYQLKREGQGLTSNGKVAMFLVLQDMEKINHRINSSLSDSGQNENVCDIVKGLFSDHQRFVQMEGRSSVPLVLTCSAYSLSSLQELFLDHDYFGFDREKVWLLEEEKLPAVTIVSGGHR